MRCIVSIQSSKDYSKLAGDKKLVWFKASASGANQCVEVAQLDGLVAVRDSMNTDRSALLYTSDEWQAFINGAKKGEFDHLI
jgi:Domain of unknown function (DUF397)